jgi:hypothetical protein
MLSQTGVLAGHCDDIVHSTHAPAVPQYGNGAAQSESLPQLATHSSPEQTG